MTNRFWIALCAFAALAGGAFADDLLGSGRGGGSGGGSGGASGGDRGPGPKAEPPPRRVDERRNDDPIRVGSGLSRSDRPIVVESARTPRQGRSGVVRYGTQSNLTNLEARRSPIRVDSTPEPRSRGSSLEAMVRRDENVRPARYRDGYVHHDLRWRDDYFAYPHYDFRYDPGFSVVSPWYCYPHLPAYLDQRRVTIMFDAAQWDYRNRHDWTHRARYDERSSTYAVDVAVADLVRAVTRRDLRALGRLVPRRTSVLIVAPNGERYRLSSDDYFDMMVDLVEQTRTRRYDVLEVMTGRTSVRVVARHEFDDTWGRRATVRHEYVLEWDGRNYSIVQFASQS